MSLAGSLRGRAKAGFERALRGYAQRSLRHGAMRGRRLVLAYHGVRPAGEAPAGEAVLHIEQARFEAQLGVLRELARVVALADLLEPSSEDEERPRVAITWDDAYAGAVSLGVDALVARGLPATLFVAPGRLGGQTFWWDRVAMRHGGWVPPAVREHALRDLAGDEGRVVAALEGGRPADGIPAWARSADVEALGRAAALPGITLASHSWSHPNLDAAGPERLDEELGRPLRWLSERFASFRPWLALPYGLGSAPVRQQALLAGHAAVFLIREGWLPRDRRDPASIPRLNVPAGLSVDGLVLRLRGLFCK